MNIIPYILVIMTVVFNAHAADYEIPDDVSLINSCFNHTTGSTSDALRLKYDHTTIVPAPEWTATNTESIGYVAGTPADLLIEITRSSFDIDSLKVRLVTDSTSIGTYSDTWFTFSGPPEESDYLRNASGGIPSGVGVNPLKLEWYIVQVNDDQPFQNPVLFALTRHEYYAVLDTPQAPMDSAWVDVLEIACDYASGASTADSVNSKIAHNLYDGLGGGMAELDYGNSSAPYGGFSTGSTNANRKFDLTEFLSVINIVSEVKVWCYDMGNLFNIFTLALGCNSNTQHLYHTVGSSHDYVTFWFNELDLTGDTRTWETSIFTNHLYGIIDSSYIYDACIMLKDGGGNPYVPVKMTEQNYFTAYIDSTPPGAVRHTSIGCVGIE